MASVFMDTGSARDRVTGVFLTDFCPWANKYVYWLKEPIGWFVTALGISVLVGLHVSSVGWVLASVISSVIAVGMIWPWFVVHAAQCRLVPAVEEVHEGQPCDLVLTVRNRLPVPLWGPAIEGYLDGDGDEARPTIALACVPMLSDAEYRLRISPELRGHYPVTPPKIVCSMPFGIYTARRSLQHFSPLTVFPAVSRIEDDPELAGGKSCESGDGLRVGEFGEPLGVREFRSGDRLRNVHWIHTARVGSLVVCERGGPQQQIVDVVLDTQVAPGGDTELRRHQRESLARRVRVAAGVAMALHSRHVPIRLVIDGRPLQLPAGAPGRRRLLSELADVPADGTVFSRRSVPAAFEPPRDRMSILVRGNPGDLSDGATYVDVFRQSSRSAAASFAGSANAFEGNGSRLKPGLQRVRIDAGESLERKLARFWREVNRAHVVA